MKSRAYITHDNVCDVFVIPRWFSMIYNDSYGFSYFFLWFISKAREVFSGDSFIIFRRYGRRLVMLIGSALMMIFMSAGAFSPNLWVYILFRVLTGFTLPGNIVNTFVIITEYTGPKRRPLAGRLQWTTACFGLIIMGITAMYIKSWKILTLTAIVPYFFIFAFYK